MSFAFMPLYSGDYLRDTRHLTPLRHGVYLLLLMHCWDSRGPVPLDEQEAAGVANCRSADEVEALRYVLNRFFTRMEDGWYNRRIQREIERAESISRVRSDAGRMGYQAKAKHMLSKSQAQATTPTPTTTTTATTTTTEQRFALSSPLDEGDGGAAVAAVRKAARAATYTAPKCPHDQIVALYHATFPTLPRVEIVSEKRKATIGARWREVCVDGKLATPQQAVDVFDAIFKRGARSKFLTGRKTDWRASFDWLMAPTNFVKVAEGHYD